VCWSLQEFISIHSVDPEDGSPRVIEALKGILTRMDSKRFYAPDTGCRNVSVITTNSQMQAFTKSSPTRRHNSPVSSFELTLIVVYEFITGV
jgi:hypothetical protein